MSTKQFDKYPEQEDGELMQQRIVECEPNVAALKKEWFGEPVALPWVIEYKRKDNAHGWKPMAAFDFAGPAKLYLDRMLKSEGADWPWNYRVVEITVPLAAPNAAATQGKCESTQYDASVASPGQRERPAHISNMAQEEEDVVVGKPSRSASAAAPIANSKSQYKRLVTQGAIERAAVLEIAKLYGFRPDIGILAFVAALEKEWFGEPVAWMVNTHGGEFDYNVFTDLRDAKSAAEDYDSIVVALYTAQNAAATQVTCNPQGGEHGILQQTMPTPAPAAASYDEGTIRAREHL